MKEADDFAYDIEHFTDKQLKESIYADIRDGIFTYIFMLPKEQQQAIRESGLYQDYETSMEEAFAQMPIGTFEKGDGRGFEIQEVADRKAFKRFKENAAKVIEQIEKKLEDSLVTDPEDPSAGFEDYIRRLQAVLAQREEVLRKAQAELKEAKSNLEDAQNRESRKESEQNVYNPFNTGAGLANAKEDVERAKREVAEKQKAVEAAEKRSRVIISQMTEEAYQANLEKGRQVLQADFGKRLKDNLDGYSLAWFFSHDPLRRSTENWQAILNVSAQGLAARIAVSTEECPIYDVVIDAGKLTDNQLSYLKEKENGTLTEESMQEYRQNLHKGIRSVMKKLDRFDETAWDPKLNEEFRQLGITDIRNEPFEMSTPSNRGHSMFRATIEAYKTGLESNWHMDDLSALALFNTARQAFHKDADYDGKSTKRAGISKREKPLYSAPAKEQLAAQMDQLWQAIETTPLTGAKERDEYLKQMHTLMGTAAQKGWLNEQNAKAFEQTYQKVRERDAAILSGRESAFVRTSFDEPKYPVASDEDLKNSIVKNFANRYNALQASVRTKVKLNLPDELFDDSDMAKEAFNLDYDDRFFTANHVLQNVDVFEISDQSKFEEFKELGQKTLNEWNQTIDDLAVNEPEGETVKALLKAQGLNQLQRDLSGFSKEYINTKWPMSYAAQGLIAELGIDMDGSMPAKLQAAGESFPIYDLVIESDQQVQTVTDYFSEKEKGKIPAEREQLYRQKLYDQTVSMIGMIEKMSDTAMNNRPEAEKLVKLRVVESDPFQLSKYGARGSGPLLSYLEAQKDGLENGWAIEDLPILGTYLAFARKERGTYLHNDVNDQPKFKIYDPPKYPSDECRQYFDKVDALYESIKTTPLESSQQRTKVLDSMQRLLIEGRDKGFIDPDSSTYNLFFQQKQKMEERDRAIEKGLERAFDTKITANPAVQAADLYVNEFETRRSAFFMGRESDEHKALRKAVAEYKELSKSPFQTPEKDAGKADKDRIFQENLEKAEKLLESLDKMEMRADDYIRKKEGADTEAGKARLRGAKKLRSRAELERKQLIESLNAGRGTAERVSLREVYTQMAIKNGDKAMETLEGMDRALGKKADKELVRSLAADVIVMQFATSRVAANAENFGKAGPAKMKEQILASKEFKAMADAYLDGKKSGKDLAADLMSGKCTQKISKMQKQFKEEKEAREKRIDEIKVAPKKKAAKAPS